MDQNPYEPPQTQSTIRASSNPPAEQQTDRAVIERLALIWGLFLFAVTFAGLLWMFVL